MNLYLSTHIFIPKSSVRDIAALKDTLSPVSRFGGSGIPTYSETSEYFGVPWFYKPTLIADPRTVDRRCYGDVASWKFTSTLRPNQQKMFQEFVRAKQEGKTGFVIEALPAYGKTTTILAMLSVIGRAALIVVNKSDLVDQWVERMCHPTKGHTSLKREQIGIAINGKCDDPAGKDVFVALVHTLNLNRFPKEFKRKFGVVVFDEVDRSVPPETFAPVMCLFPARYRIGASATIKRQDGLHKIFEWHMGEVLLKGSDEGRITPSVIVHWFNKSSGKIYGNTKLTRRGVFISKISVNPERNKLICVYANSVYKSDRRVIVISDRTEQLCALKTILMDSYKIPETEIGFYVNTLSTAEGRTKISKKELKRVAKESRIVLATYGMMKIGTDIPDMAGLIFATPQSDITQVKGRIERQCLGKKKPVVVDIIDCAGKEVLDAKKGWIKKYEYPEIVNAGGNRIRQYTNAHLSLKEYGNK